MNIYEFIERYDDGTLTPSGMKLCERIESQYCEDTKNMFEHFDTHDTFKKYRKKISDSYRTLSDKNVSYVSYLMYLKIRAKPVNSFFARMEIFSDCVRSNVCNKDSIPETLMEDGLCLWKIYEPGILAYRARHGSTRYLIHTEDLFATYKPQNKELLYRCHVWGGNVLKELTGRDFSKDAQNGN